MALVAPRPAFAEVWEKLGLEGKTEGIALGATITDRTFRSADATPIAKSTEAASPLPLITLDGLPQSASTPARTPETSGSDLEVTGILGEGGMGRVHLVHQKSLGRDVAVKVVKTGASDNTARDALLREGAFMGSLEHPNVIPVHALGRDARGEPVLVMKRVEGVPWRDLIYDASHPAWVRLDAESGDRQVQHLQILMQVCNALELAHRRGVIHRDIKPSNVMVGEFGEIYLLDFGIAMRAHGAQPSKLQSDSSATDELEDEPLLVGTPGYMAPEMAACETWAIDARTDVYLLGATLHEILTGRLRHAAEGVFEALMLANESRPFVYDSAVPADLAAICNKAMSRERDDRYPSALELRRAVAAYLSHRSSVALTRAAEERLSEIRAILAAKASGTHGASDETVYGVMTACRFGFMQALREWRDNAVAQQGLTACLEVMVEHQIQLSNTQGARALLTELGDHRKEFEERIQAIEASERDKALRAGKLERIEKDLDVSVSARPRAILFALAALVGIAVTVQLVVSGGSADTLSYDTVIWEMISVVVGVGIILAIFRKKLLTNMVSTRIIATGFIFPFTMLITRIIGKIAGEPLHLVITVDQLICSAIMAMGGMTIYRPFLWIAPVLLAGALASACWPEVAVKAFAFSVLLVCGSLALAGVRGRQAP